MVEGGNVVEDFYVGKVRIRICDDYCKNKTKEEVQKILDRISRNASLAISAANALNEAKNEMDEEDLSR